MKRVIREEAYKLLGGIIMGEKGKVVMSVKSLAKKYGEIEVLKKIDLDIHE